MLDIYTIEGKKSGKIAIPKILDIEVKPKLIQQAYQAELSKKRFPTAHAKDRGQVAGSGKKPWRQKGTGRARAGSVRSPLWRGGGITFGPNKDINFLKKLPKNQRKNAIYSCLAAKIKDEKVIIVSKIEQKNIKTKEFESKLQNLPFKDTILVVIKKFDEKIIKSATNLAYAKVITLNRLNLTDLLTYKYLIIEKSVFKNIGQKSVKA